jgi:hypothetical protein
MVDGVITTAYSINYSTGLITFSVAPIDGAEISILYSRTKYDDEFLVSYLKRGVVTVESMYTLGYTTSGSGTSIAVSPDPTEDVTRLWRNMAKFLVKRDNLIEDMENALSWRDGDKSVNTVSTVQAQRGILNEIWEEIVWDLERLGLEGTVGEVLAGGTEPTEFGSYLTGTGPQSEDFLWFNGEIG